MEPLKGQTERVVALLLEYDGSRFAGWQSQKNACAVQDALASAILRLDPLIVTKPVGASRTDAGVHARGQVASFRTRSAIPADKYAFALNAILPEGVACARSWGAPEGFHARHSSFGKTYSYRILNRVHPSATERSRSWHCPRPLDFGAMRGAASLMEGTRDFRAFMAAGSPVKSTVRPLWRVEVTASPRLPALSLARRGVAPGTAPCAAASAASCIAPGSAPCAAVAAASADAESMLDGYDAVVYVCGGGFLYNMVRIIVGTLVYVGEGRIAADDVPSIIASGERARAGKTAPPQGLCLERVHY